MKTLLFIGTGSFIGGVSRYVLSRFVQAKVYTSFPYGTMLVNITGCFLIGMVFALSERGNLSADWRLFLATGILGGFTTFSAFSNETAGMLRDGQLAYAFYYVAGSILLGVVATFLGIIIIKSL
ncbi:MAG: fluoride efflux transporter CrcB [Syntrophothermus sp.]